MEGKQTACFNLNSEGYGAVEDNRRRYLDVYTVRMKASWVDLHIQRTGVPFSNFEKKTKITNYRL